MLKKEIKELKEKIKKIQVNPPNPESHSDNNSVSNRDSSSESVNPVEKKDSSPSGNFQNEIKEFFKINEIDYKDFNGPIGIVATAAIMGGGLFGAGGAVILGIPMGVAVGGFTLIWNKGICPFFADSKK